MRFFDRTAKSRAGIAAACGASVAAAALSGCMSSPTYGTDKTATQQLVGDVTNILQIGPKPRPAIDYKPRPELVKPVRGEAENLPAPQDSVASIGNPAWVESPEQKRARLRAEADENSDDPLWRPTIEPDGTVAPARRAPTGTSPHVIDTGNAPSDPASMKSQSEAFRKKLAETRQGNAKSRKYLSEPPIDYRQASATAPVGELGEDEVKKERRLKAEATKKNGRKWGDLWPF